MPVVLEIRSMLIQDARIECEYRTMKLREHFNGRSFARREWKDGAKVHYLRLGRAGDIYSWIEREPNQRQMRHKSHGVWTTNIAAIILNHDKYFENK